MDDIEVSRRWQKRVVIQFKSNNVEYLLSYLDRILTAIVARDVLLERTPNSRLFTLGINRCTHVDQLLDYLLVLFFFHGQSPETLMHPF